MLLAGATFVLIFVGGLVKSTGSELSVPDWPLAYGKLIPSLQGGVLFEYSHRVVAGVVSILTLALMVWAILREPRYWVRVLATAAFALVIAQAVLGGITVLFLIPLPIAMAHTATANAFFCIVVALAIFTSSWFLEVTPREESLARIPLATLAAVTTGVIYLQILIGALMRHLGAGLAIPDFPTSFGQAIPPVWNEFIAINFIHRCGAVIVTCFVAWTVARVLVEPSQGSAAAPSGTRADTSTHASNLSWCDYDLDSARGLSDHRACCDRLRGSRDQSHHHNSRVEAVWHPRRAGCDRDSASNRRSWRSAT